MSILLAANIALVLTAPAQVNSGVSSATSAQIANRKITTPAGVDFSCDTFRGRLIIGGLPMPVTQIRIRSSVFFEKEGGAKISVPSISPELWRFGSSRSPMRIYMGKSAQIVSPNPRIVTFIRSCANASRKTY